MPPKVDDRQPEQGRGNRPQTVDQNNARVTEDPNDHEGRDDSGANPEEARPETRELNPCGQDKENPDCARKTVECAVDKMVEVKPASFQKNRE